MMCDRSRESEVTKSTDHWFFVKCKDQLLKNWFNIDSSIIDRLIIDSLRLAAFGKNHSRFGFWTRWKQENTRLFGISAEPPAGHQCRHTIRWTGRPADTWLTPEVGSVGNRNHYQVAGGNGSVRFDTKNWLQSQFVLTVVSRITLYGCHLANGKNPVYAWHKFQRGHWRREHEHLGDSGVGLGPRNSWENNIKRSFSSIWWPWCQLPNSHVAQWHWRHCSVMSQWPNLIQSICLLSYY